MRMLIVGLLVTIYAWCAADAWSDCQHAGGTLVQGNPLHWFVCVKEAE